jgi:hypothetical protein
MDAEFIFPFMQLGAADTGGNGHFWFGTIMCHVVFSLQVQRPEEGMVPCESSSRAHLGLWRSQQIRWAVLQGFSLPIGSSMGASHCKDEEWRPDLYLKVAASIVPKELDITSQGVADMSDEDVLRIIDAVRALVADVELMLTPGQDHDLTCAEPLIDCSWCVSLVNACVAR